MTRRRSRPRRARKSRLLPAAPALRRTAVESGDASQLRNWPVQLRLAPVKAAYFDGADLLVAADCSAYACGSFHADFMKGRVTLIGCPKLDPVDYAEKLGEILAANDIKSVTLARMQVPCCGGLEHALQRAIAATGKKIPLRVFVVAN